MKDLKDYALPVEEQIACFNRMLTDAVLDKTKTPFSISEAMINYLQAKHEIICIKALLFLYFPLFTRKNAERFICTIESERDKKIQFLKWMVEQLEGKRAMQGCNPSNGGNGAGRVGEGRNRAVPAPNVSPINERTGISASI